MNTSCLILCVTLFVTIFTLGELSNTTDFDEFVEEIEEFVNNSDTYVLPTNKDAYFSDENDTATPTDYGTYDFIIVGGGAAGGVLANRLTEIENFTVLVVEAGKVDPPISKVIGLAAYLKGSDWNWGYWSTVQTKGCLGSPDQKCRFTAGKGLGGGSSINWAMHVRGNAADFDKWEELGNSGWGYSDCLTYFKKSQFANFSTDIDEDYQGTDGPQSITIAEDTPTLTQELINAFKELGKTEGDYNGADQYSISRIQYFSKYNVRSTTANAYVRPVIDRSNLEIIFEALVTKIQISNNTATGIEFWQNGTAYTATASKEVILSAGSIGSPQLLMLSGIGPQDELEKYNITTLVDLPVGKNLIDHINYRGIFYRTDLDLYNGTLEENLELWNENKMPLIAPGSVQTITFYNFEGNTSSTSDFEVVMAGPPGSGPSIGTLFDDEYAIPFEVLNASTDISVQLILMHQLSRGTVTLQSSDPRDYPIIDLNYFAESQDLELFYLAIEEVLKLGNTTAFQRLGATPIYLDLPDCDDAYDKLSKDWWLCSVQYLSISTLHPVGTTAMGTNATTSVVSSNLKVHGIDQLRVIDAGVMPTTVSGHTYSATVMIAEKGADIIKEEYGYVNNSKV